MTQDIKNTDNLDILKNKINDISAFFKNTLSSTDKRPLVGWFCTYTPEELIVAGGFIPVRIFGRKKLIKSESYFPVKYLWAKDPKASCFIASSNDDSSTGCRYPRTEVRGTYLSEFKLRLTVITIHPRTEVRGTLP